jgi:uncharacterized protein YqgV (UPF0045/DUF77 family)
VTVVMAQVSLYPLGQGDLAPAIEAFVATLREQGLQCEVGAMSTLVWGEDSVVCSSLQRAYAAALAHGPAVLQITLSNACPLPEWRADSREAAR